QAMHDHFADFRRRQFALRRFVNNAFNFIHYCFKLGRRNRPLFASLQESLQNLLPLESLAPAIFFDNHVRDFVDPFVCRESSFAFQTLTAAANRIARPPFARIDHFVIGMPAKGTLHASPPRSSWVMPRSASCFNSSFSCSAISRNWPNENPSRMSKGNPAMVQEANVTR